MLTTIPSQDSLRKENVVKQHPVMTHAHLHDKACEMWPTQKPVMVQNNTDHCQLKGRLHSTRTLCIATTREGGGSRSLQQWGGARGTYMRSGGDLLQQLPSPERDAFTSLLAPDQNASRRAAGPPSARPLFPCCFPESNFTRTR